MILASYCKSPIRKINPPKIDASTVFSISVDFPVSSFTLANTFFSSAFESGVAAKLLGTVNAVVFGGVMTLLTVVTTALVSPSFRKLDLRKDVEDHQQS